ncbi:S1 family peptidase [Bdellovibrio sp. HCB-162]|uniref:S1 family peptidase n=1 Tax=Bdellovibrio sp. HCB-162 TaxID=3394234 RepID=UPI0039BD3CE2
MNKISLLLTVLLFVSACAKNETGNLNISESNSAIIGGTAATVKDLVTHSTVSFLMEYQGKPLSLCTGTLISKNMVLTATHCLENLGEGIMAVYIGEKLPEVFDRSKFLKVAGWVTHPRYKLIEDQNNVPVTGVNDVAVLRLADEAPASAIPVPILDPKTNLQDGQSLLLAGYGLENELNVPVYATGLNYVHVPLAKIVDAILVTDQTNNQGACSGDSGGPAFIETAKGLVVVGVTRGPHDQAQDCRHYGEYTYASKFKSFILKATAQLKGEAPKFVTLQ